jgi:hypothetical protein
MITEQKVYFKRKNRFRPVEVMTKKGKIRADMSLGWTNWKGQAIL